VAVLKTVTPGDGHAEHPAEFSRKAGLATPANPRRLRWTRYFGLKSGLPPAVPAGGIIGIRVDAGRWLGGTGIDIGGRWMTPPERLSRWLTARHRSSVLHRRRRRHFRVRVLACIRLRHDQRDPEWEARA
jgi:hypothetical protein